MLLQGLDESLETGWQRRGSQYDMLGKVWGLFQNYVELLMAS